MHKLEAKQAKAVCKADVSSESKVSLLNDISSTKESV